MSTHSSLPTSPHSLSRDEMNKEAPQAIHFRLERNPSKLEHLDDYEAGGHHPLHLHDLVGESGRYRVIHKLGNGGFSNVWLCQDTEVRETTKYVALKILISEASDSDHPELRINQVKNCLITRQEQDEAADSICLPLDQFTVDGPNGHHLCFVYPVLGPKVSLGLFQASGDPDKALRTICLKLVRAVGFLHSQGICHGDITPNNALHHIHGLDGLLEDEVLQILGSPIRNPVSRGSLKDHDEPAVPQYLVYPVKWQDVARQYISEEPCLIDFGESFDVAHPPEDLGIPGPYRSPELILDNKIGFGADLWALGCTLFEVRTGRKLFSTFDDDDDCYLDAMVQVLGNLPEPWWSTTWRERKRMYKDEPDEQGRALDAVEPEKNSEKVNTGTTTVVHPSVAEGARSLVEKLSPGVWYLSNGSQGGEIHRDIPQTEIDIFADLLGRLLKYTPKDRISAAGALDHEWFRL